MSFYKIHKKKVIIFDFDGVILNSKKYEWVWRYTSKSNNLNNSFENYFQYVGLPFFKI